MIIIDSVEAIIIDTSQPPQYKTYIDSSTILVNAMIMVESRGIDSCIGDKHLSVPSIGVLQIRPVMVKEVN